MIRFFFTSLLLVFLASISHGLLGQEMNDGELKTERKSGILIQGDTRRTFVDRESANIFGVRAGWMLSDRVETGVGIYSSNLFGILGNNVSKPFIIDNTPSPMTLDSEVGFHYFSVYGEYTFLSNKRIILTANTQLGLGRVDIDFPQSSQESRREIKSLVEHSVKADVLTLPWLRLIGGVGYRYLPLGEDQIKAAFNSPIIIVGFSIDFKKLFGKK